MIISDEKLEEIRKESTEFLDRLKDRVHEQEWKIKHLEDLYNQALKDYDKSLEEIEQLQLELDNEKSNSTKAYKRIVKAIEYIKNNYPVCAGIDLLDILQEKDD